MRLFVTALFAAFIAAWAAPGLALAQAASGAPGTLAVVSLSRVLAESRYVQSQRGDLQRLLEDRNAHLQAEREAAFVNSWFSPEELAEAQGLRARDDLSPEERARLQELMNLSSARQRELQTLQQKPNAQFTDADRERLNSLLAWRREATARSEEISRLQEGLQQELNTAQDDALQRWQQRVSQAVGQVAQEAGISLVFEADALAYFAPPLDITPQVIARVDAETSTPEAPSAPPQ